MLYMYEFFIGVFAALALLGWGFKLGSTRGTWTTRVLSTFGCAASATLVALGPDTFAFVSSGRYEGWIFLALFNTLAFCGGMSMASWLSSTVPAHNVLLAENEGKPSKKSAALAFIFAGIFFAMAAFMGVLFSTIPVYHDAPGLYCLVVMLVASVGLLTASAGFAHLKPESNSATAPFSKWSVIWLGLLVGLPLIFGFKWLGALAVLVGAPIACWCYRRCNQPKRTGRRRLTRCGWFGVD